jgi:LacI family transcriptional regulator
MPEDLRRPTLKDVAALAGVSIKTASRVINEERFVSEEVATKVQAAVRTLGYRRDHLASTLKRANRSATIGLVIADVANPFFSAITRVVENAALAEGHLLITVSSDDDPRRERQIVDRLVQRRIDGLLIASARHDHQFLKREMDHGMAVVFFDRPPVRLAADAVLLEDERGARLAVEHLLADGHRRVALLSDVPPDVYTARQRYAGYSAALRDAGIKIDERITRFGLHNPGQTQETVTEMLKRRSAPTAFFATNNRTAVGAAEALADRPEIGLVGVDDFELASALRRPITVIAFDTDEMARHAAEMLFSRLTGNAGKPERRMIAPRLLVRGVAIREASA